MTDTPKALRELADLIERYPELTPRSIEAVRYVWGPEEQDDFPSLVRQLGGKRTKSDNGITFSVSRDFGGGVVLRVAGERDAVCTKRVVGTETVEVPDYVNVPTKTVEREIVEWDCAPILEGS